MVLSRRTAVLVTVVAALAGIPATPVSADPSGGKVVARWDMDERRGATRLVDSSGHRRHGRIGSAVTTRFRSGNVVGHDFPSHFPKDEYFPGHVTTVREQNRLDPGTKPYAVTIRYRTTDGFGNVIQKGQNGAVGGYWKLEAPDGRPICVFRDRSGVAQRVKADVALDDGRWHRVTCFRTTRKVELWVDGDRLGLQRRTAGPINNRLRLAIGGKASCGADVTCDYFFGEVDLVRISKG
jgi:hypothetical protein